MTISTAKIDEKLSQNEAQRQRLEAERQALLQRQAEAEEVARQTRVATATVEVRATLNEAFDRMRKANEQLQTALAEVREALQESDRLTGEYHGQYNQARTRLVQSNATGKEISDAIKELEPMKLCDTAVVEVHRNMNQEWGHNWRTAEKEVPFGKLAKTRHLIVSFDRGY
jgi:multidrug efflux pump subunit AcrA (membrane-fusion protein)